MTPKSPVHSNRRLPGKMHRWQRHASFWIIGICLFSGICWFSGMDLLHLPPGPLRTWWVLHGCSALLSTMLIGAALPQHLIVTWKARRNLKHGVLVVAGLLLLLVTALLLLYGQEAWHDAAHWAHSLIGLVIALAFPWHIIRGRRQAHHVHQAQHEHHHHH